MQGTYNFIRFRKIILKDFSLYKKNGKVYEVNEEINQGVYCLAGANGLGKTTFLNSINYGLTGIVLDPDREFYFPNEIEKFNGLYTERYFHGRLEKKYEQKAEIEIEFIVNDKYFRIVRGFFERDELRDLEVFSINGNKKNFHFKKAKQDQNELNLQYQKLLVKEMGFVSFEYFMFYQLYILTFDENRRMIFWNEKASNTALSVAFNSDPRDAEKLSDLSKRIERHESNGRNARWQATQAKNKIDELVEKTKGKKRLKNEKIESEYIQLNKELEKTEKKLSNIGIELDSLLKAQSHLNSEIMHLKNDYAKFFSLYSKPRSKLTDSTNIKLSLRKHECCLCGTHSIHIIDSIERNIHKEKCPLCDTKINESTNSQQNKLLKLIQKSDEKISKKNDKLNDLIEEIEGKQIELEKAEFEFDKAKDKLSDFINVYPDLAFKGTGNENIDSLIEQYQKQFKLFDTEAKEEYSKRDKLKPALEQMLGIVEKAYKEARIIFVPIFKKLAISFIGLDLNIQPNKGTKGIKLVLELQDTARTEPFQLSESQRFFLDIALRMSLAIFLSSKASGATMLIDTPEGSLDIAYESRVGNMFAEFTNSYKQNLLMTANINASQLLLTLAEKSGKNKMQFRRMLEWTDLSAVQKEGEQLFKTVFNNIEKSLNKKK